MHGKHECRSGIIRVGSELIALAIASALAGCGGSGGSHSMLPTEPAPVASPTPTPAPAEFLLHITSTLTASSSKVGVGAESVIFDGTQILALSTCRSGTFLVCHSREVKANAPADRGQHKIEIRLLKHLCNLDPCGSRPQGYAVACEVIVERSGNIVRRIDLRTPSVALAEGDRVTYNFDL